MENTLANTATTVLPIVQALLTSLTVTAVFEVAQAGHEASRNNVEGRINQMRVSHPPHAKLSDRELQVLYLFGEGKTVKQIAEELVLSAPTVSTYRARILDKMDMKSTAELVRYAVQNQIASPK